MERRRGLRLVSGAASVPLFGAQQVHLEHKGRLTANVRMLKRNTTYDTATWNVVDAYRLYRVRHLLPYLGPSQFIWSQKDDAQLLKLNKAYNTATWDVVEDDGLHAVQHFLQHLELTVSMSIWSVKDDGIRATCTNWTQARRTALRRVRSSRTAACIRCGIFSSPWVSAGSSEAPSTAEVCKCSN
jgi:hypothetical protein